MEKVSPATTKEPTGGMSEIEIHAYNTRTNK